MEFFLLRFNTSLKILLKMAMLILLQVIHFEIVVGTIPSDLIKSVTKFSPFPILANYIAFSPPNHSFKKNKPCFVEICTHL